MIEKGLKCKEDVPHPVNALQNSFPANDFPNLKIFEHILMCVQKINSGGNSTSFNFIYYNMIFLASI